MTKRMLIDATHEEETRVAVMDGKKLIEFDYESKFRQPLKSSIFLAKVTRVEPSLQAAFVNFGGNRHGFLPFSEIHPDYFRIPIADREALIAEQEEALRAAAEEEDEADEAESSTDPQAGENSAPDADNDENGDDEIEEIGGEGPLKNEGNDIEQNDSDKNFMDETETESQSDPDGNRADGEDSDDNTGNIDESSEQGDDDRGNSRRRWRGGNGRRGGQHGGGRGRRGRQKYAAHDSRKVESFGGEDTGRSGEDRFRYNLRRRYKIQEVIKRGQIMLVQVSKEERGNKGAAVTSYLSLPGRYCVLMPNSPHGGGVSRKIANYQERARMREIMKDLTIPKGMSVILRTAGVSRTKAEINRDLDYLMRLWDNIRELTLQSNAPEMVYQEADLIKRSVRDLYSRDIDEILVHGEEGFKTAKNFMKMMMPSHTKRVKEYKGESVPLFQKYAAEVQIAEIGEMQVTLPAGGYLIINPTEALVSIDVNSGKATKERHIEETALRTNLEAAQEVARQLKLRDLGGLIVIDFIDMEDRRNNRKVENALRDALSGDRARIQMGRISSFGLMELSRQRLNPSLTESQYRLCTHCGGSGRVRTADSTAIMVLRAIEDEGMKKRAAQLIVHVGSEVALFILNNKRQHLNRLEEQYNLTVLIRVDDSLSASTYRVEVSRPATADARSNDKTEDEEDRELDTDENGSDDDSDEETDAGETPEPQRDRKSTSRRPDDGDESTGPDGNRKRRGRRGGRGRRSSGSSREDGDSSPRERTPRRPENADHEKPQQAEPAHHREEAKSKLAEKDSMMPKDPPSNDDKPKNLHAKEFEVVNEQPSEKKRGWWNRLTD